MTQPLQLIASCKGIRESLGFWILIVSSILDSLSCITESKAQYSLEQKGSLQDQNAVS